MTKLWEDQFVARFGAFIYYGHCAPCGWTGPRRIQEVEARVDLGSHTGTVHSQPSDTESA